MCWGISVPPEAEIVGFESAPRKGQINNDIAGGFCVETKG